MKKRCFLLYLSLITLYFSGIKPYEKYEKFALCQADIDATLKSALALPIKNASNWPADISFACADIKYDDGKVKFCECGDGIYMSFRTAPVSINNNVERIVAPYWGIFWHYIKQFNLPMWHVGDRGMPNAMAFEEFAKLGGKQLDSLQLLESDDTFKKLQKKNFQTGNTISDYSGIIVYRAKRYDQRDDKEIIAFKKRHPEFLFVNDIARPYMIKKDATYQLFNKAGLSNFVPLTKTYPKKYSSEIVHTILGDFQSDKLVVKPVYSSESCGVNIIEREKLNELLKLIIDNRKKCTGHRCFTYWRTCKNNSFVVAEYAPSKIIYKDDKPYDPTMRIVFMFHHDKETISVNVIAGFWKIPVKTLNDPVSLTEKHVTIAHAGEYYTGILASPEDWALIKQKLEQALPVLYMTMLQEKVMHS